MRRYLSAAFVIVFIAMSGFMGRPIFAQKPSGSSSGKFLNIPVVNIPMNLPIPKNVLDVIAAYAAYEKLGFLYGSAFEKVNSAITKAILDKIKENGSAELKNVTYKNINALAITSPKLPRWGDENSQMPNFIQLQYFHMYLSHLSWPPFDEDYDLKACYDNNILPFSVTNGGRVLWAKMKLKAGVGSAKRYYAFVPIFHALKNGNQMYMNLRCDTDAMDKTGGAYNLAIGDSAKNLQKVLINEPGFPLDFNEIHFFVSDVISLPQYNYTTYHPFVLSKKLFSTVQENEAFELDWVKGYVLGFLLYEIELPTKK